LFFWSRFSGRWFGELGRTGIFVNVSLPLAPIWRSGRRRGNGVGRFRTFFRFNVFVRRTRISLRSYGLTLRRRGLLRVVGNNDPFIHFSTFR
jgi:hypothetical protein